MIFLNKICGCSRGEGDSPSLLFEANVVLFDLSECDLQHWRSTPPNVRLWSAVSGLKGRYLRMFFSRHGAERWIYGSIDLSLHLHLSAVIRALYQTVVKETSTYVLAVIFGHESKLMNNSAKSKIQAVTMSFLCRVTELSLRARLQSLYIWKDLRGELLLSRVESCQLRLFHRLVTMPLEVLGACLSGRRPLGTTINL